MTAKTIEQRTQEALDRRIKTHGSNAPSVRMLREQLESLQNPRSVQEIFLSAPIVNRKSVDRRVK